MWVVKSEDNKSLELSHWNNAMSTTNLLGELKLKYLSWLQFFTSWIGGLVLQVRTGILRMLRLEEFLGFMAQSKKGISFPILQVV